MKRGSGILLHLTSLPSPYGIGDLGPQAYKFADFLQAASQSYWQILPVNPTYTEHGNSPYSCYSAFAGNTLLISPDLLVKQGFLSRADIKVIRSFSAQRVNYKTVTIYKNRILGNAFIKNRPGLSTNSEFRSFCADNTSWLDDYALFIALKEHLGDKPWSRWPRDIRDREGQTLKKWEKKLSERILMEKFFQYIFFRQWFSLKDYCENKNIQIIGDVPISVNYESEDVWINPDIFKLDRTKKPAFVAGTPPGYFSPTGQLWGQAVYNWDVLRKTGYHWWVKRMGHNIKLFSKFRLDHFRGFLAYWEVRAKEKTAVRGKWVSAPAEDFFNTLVKRFTHLPIIAEDLGDITPDVRELLNVFGLPGMRVLLFGFGENFPANRHLPHNYVKKCAAYAGMHDNNTLKGWFRKEAGHKVRQRIFQYLGRKVLEKDISAEFIKLVMGSVADMVITNMQDILGLGEKARMNLPGSSKGNWEWRLLPGQITPLVTKRLKRLTKIYDRE